ncbi:hypothetical protein ONZ45_g9522 [Pleurotus djamor]|nr:hypothetical protein ONZ45_g9522 [Pleurotus djamor]
MDLSLLKNLKLSDDDLGKKEEDAGPSESKGEGNRGGTSLFDKLGDVLSGGDQAKQEPVPPSKTGDKDGENIFEKIGNFLGGKEPSPPPPPPPKQDASVLEKITGIFDGDRPPAVAHAPETKKDDDVGLLEKISGAIQGSQPEPKPQGLGDKINNALGGGAKGEAKEDMLDKAIDLVQEHVFKKGPQNDESALEQAKDKQIADVIRDQYQNLTGKEFPVKEKK